MFHFMGLEHADQTSPKSPMDDGRTMISEETLSVSLWDARRESTYVWESPEAAKAVVLFRSQNLIKLSWRTLCPISVRQLAQCVGGHTILVY